MARERWTAARIAALFDGDRVHRDAYTDADLFELERERVFARTWLYVAHDSEMPEAGRFVTRTLAGRPVFVLRGEDGAIRVFHNRCPHRGARILADRSGDCGRRVVCPYHAWSFALDGTDTRVPLAEGYAGTRLDPAALGLAPVGAVADHRGFLFARLAADGPSLAEWLGEAALCLDDMVDRAPSDRLEIAPGCFRQIQRSNWKLFLENLNDTLHPRLVHMPSYAPAAALKDRPGLARQEALALGLVANNGAPVSFWEKLSILGYPQGHTTMSGIIGEPADDPDWLDYRAALVAAKGERRASEILAVSRHNTIIYPNLSIQAAFQQLRVITPLAVDRTLVEVWHFRLVDAPEGLYRNRTRVFANTVNSPSSLIVPDDVDVYARVQEGSRAGDSPWLSLHRDVGREVADGEARVGGGTSEINLRTQLGAWARCMSRP